MKVLDRFKSYADQSWYAPLIALFAVIDAFLFAIPLEGLIVPQVLVNPKRWFVSSVWITLGSAVGAVLLAWLAWTQGEAFVIIHFPDALNSSFWKESQESFQHNAFWILFSVAVMPLPHQPAIAFAGLIHVPFSTVFFAIGIARLIKYSVINACVAYGVSFASLWKLKLKRR